MDTEQGTMGNADDIAGKIASARASEAGIEATLSAAEKRVLKAFEGRTDAVLTPEKILSEGDFTGPVEVMNAISWLRSKHLINLREIVKKFYSQGREGKEFLEKGTPERRALSVLSEKGELGISELGKALGKQASVAVGWLRKKDWAEIRKEGGETRLSITERGRKALEEEDNDLKVLKKLESELPEDELSDREKKTLRALLTRKGVVRVRDAILREVWLTDAGRKVVQGGIVIRPEVSALTPELIRSGKWREVDIRPYDIHAFAPALRRGTLHPLTLLMEEIREIFVSMGFSEIQGEYVESAFWNMDVLFIPQDHPARELQDTFYLRRPARIPIAGEDENLMRTVKAIHESGGGMGSKGWRYRWSREEAEKALLRTHTTVNTIRYLSRHNKPPVKVFSLGRVFRKEAIDSTHLPEFHQIEGILMEEGASFGMLIGLLKEFYSRMGFREIRFRPAYFPYTEPSMEVEVRFEGRWLELGGSGIFRQEVTAPFGIEYPVLAWGLGLERLAMLKLGLRDIRDLYIPDIDWLQVAEGRV